MKAFAQLPTPTIATRTLPSSRRRPLADPRSAPCPSSVLIACEILLERVRRLYASNRASLHGADAPQLAPDVPDALDRGDRRQRGDHVDRGCEELEVAEPGPLREHQPGGEDDDPDRPGRDTDLALDADRLGSGARVGDHQRPEDGDHAERGGDGVAAVGEVPGDRGEDDPLLDPVERRVEERTEQASLPR